MFWGPPGCDEPPPPQQRLRGQMVFSSLLEQDTCCVKRPDGYHGLYKESQDVHALHNMIVDIVVTTH